MVRSGENVPKRSVWAFLLVVTSVTAIHSQPTYYSASEYVSMFQTLFGPGKQALIVFQEEQQGGLPGDWNDRNKRSAIKILDTKTGSIQTIAPAATGKYYVRPTITWDGQFVIYTEARSKTIFSTKVDGTGTTEIISMYENGGCWRDAGGVNYVIANEAAPIGTGGKIYKINLSTKSATLISNALGMWPSLSADGKYCAALWPNYGNAGVRDVSTTNGSVVIFGSDGKKNPACPNIEDAVMKGCWPTIAVDNSYNTLYTIEPHTQIRIASRTDATVLVKHLGTAIVGSVCRPSAEYNALRWSNDQDFCSFINESSGNGYIFKISTGAYVTLAKAITESRNVVGNKDIFFYSGQTGIVQPSRRVDSKAALGGIRESNRVFDIHGRSIVGTTRARGLFLGIEPKSGLVRNKVMHID